MKNIILYMASSGLVASSYAQSSFPPEPIGLTNVISQRWPGASISYKQTTICETTEGVKAWSGYVHMPQSVLNQVQDVSVEYDINLFFWYFEARKNSDSSPTSIYLGGGPGYTSFDSMSNFPCTINADSNSTTLNPWSWNNNVNMLYIDQPVGTGFSYSVRQNGTLNLLEQDQFGGPLFTPLEQGQDLPETNATFLAATLDPRGLETTQNTTVQAARTLWQFAQVWFQEFPEYKTQDKHVSAWGTSYGGFWATEFLSQMINQNKLIEAKEHKNVNATILPVGLLGIGNGCIDVEGQAASYPEIANHNTYGITSYPEEVEDMVRGNLTAPGVGCYDTLATCRALRAEGDPTGQGNNQTVNEACVGATAVCFGVVLEAYVAVTNRSQFDLTHLRVVGDVSNYYQGFFNQDWVQKDIGVRVNFTSNDYTYQAVMFSLTGDDVIQDKAPLENVLQNGVSVALVYGDRDYQCNWLGVENISLAVEYPDAQSFRSAGYANLVTNSSYNGGLVRQHGNFSFSRVFEAGHSVAAYQPETVYQIFQRSMFGKDVATGEVPSGANYSSQGPASALGTQNSVPGVTDENQCYTYSPTDTCTDEQLQALADGSAVARDFVVQCPAGARLDPITGSMIAAAGNGTSSSNNTGCGAGSGSGSGSGGYYGTSASTTFRESSSLALAIAALASILFC